jgi:DNA-binding beta-propeller fold protein YncE
MGNFSKGWKGYVIATVCLLGLVSAGNAAAATNLTQKAGIAGCVSETGSPEGGTGSNQCEDGRGLVGSTSIALSDDGKNAYVASSAWSSVSELARNPLDGTLAPIQSADSCFFSRPMLYTDCTSVRELGGADDVAVSPDGKNVYVAAPTDDAVIVFDRDLATGDLTLSSTTDGCVNEDGSNSCDDGRALDGATSVIASPDGKNVYVASLGSSGGLATFDRNTGTGDLTQKNLAAGCINETGADGCANGLDQMLDIRDVEISPDGKSVYAVSPTRDAVTVYARDDTTGTLTPTGCIKDSGGGGCQTGIALIEAKSLTVSPDGGTAYVAGERSDAIAVFDRDPANGALTQKAGTAGCVSNTGNPNPMQPGVLSGACQNGVAMDGIDSIAIPPDGKALYATASHSAGIAVFERHPDGTITQRPGSAGCITETGFEDQNLPWTAGFCEDGRALIDADRVISSADSKYVYTAAPEGGVGIFDVVEAPPAPIPAGTPPPQTPDTNSEACAQAKSDLRSAEKHLQATRRTIRRLTLLARNASDPDVESRLARAIKKNRRAARQWREAVRRAATRREQFCSST